MKKYFIFLFIVSFMSVVQSSNAQTSMILLDATGGTIVTDGSYVDVEGSQFLNAEWVKATITLINKRVVNNVDIKYDEVKDAVYVKGPDDQLIILNDRIKNFTYTDELQNFRTFKSGYSNIGSYETTAYFEVLTDGKVQFLKKYSKIIRSEKPYSSAITFKSFQELTKYYILVNNAAILLKRDKKAILANLSDKQSQLESFIKENNLKLKNDTDISKLISYYNSL